MSLLGFYYWLDSVDKKVIVLLLRLRLRSLRRFQKYIAVYLSRKENSENEEYCRILIKTGKG
jgi:hypothetical protein